MTLIFRTPYDQHADRRGQAFVIINKITEPDSTHDAEVLPMYRIRFEDGIELEAWPEEVETSSPWVDGLAPRTDGRQEVDDTQEANAAHGCPRDSWCILRAGHDGDCCDDRDHAPSTWNRS